MGIVDPFDVVRVVRAALIGPRGAAADVCPILKREGCDAGRQIGQARAKDQPVALNVGLGWRADIRLEFECRHLRHLPEYQLSAIVLDVIPLERHRVGAPHQVGIL